MTATRRALLLCLGCLASLTPALALDQQQATVVVEIMEAYHESSGEAVYHGGAGELYDYDLEGGGAIENAGFTRDEWTLAYDELMAGYFATIPQAEFDAAFEAPLAQLQASTSVTDEMKAVLRQDLLPRIEAARDARRNGAAFAAIVEPFLPRLHALTLGE
ncbi:MAG TPA: hypothetical protein VGN60_07960 [Devosia sp.]|jgi:hypothetical protein|nr:hypothetical protein [Devosia sp.]